MSFISIGNCSKYNIYFIVSILCYFMIDLIYGLNSSNKEKPARLFSFRPKIRDHNLLADFIRFASVFFGGLFLYIFDKYNNNKGSDELSEFENMNNDFFQDNINSRRKYIIIVSVLFSLYIIFTDFIGMAPYVGFWTFEILYISIISHFIFKIKIYKHKKLAIIIMLIISILDLVGYALPWTKHKNSKEMDILTDKSTFDTIIIKYGTYAIPLLFLANELNHVQRDYVWIQSKHLMDVRAYLPSKLFMILGSVGFIFVFIFFIIFTFIPCKTFTNIQKVNNTYINLDTGEPLQFYKEYCSLKNYDTKTKTLYLLYDSFELVIKDYSNTDRDNMLEIFVLIPLLFIFHGINEISRLMMVRYTDPNNILIYKNIHLFLQRIIKIIINKGDEQYITFLQFFLAEFKELVSIISNMIYIEVIELNFCGLDYELKKNIDKRGLKDIQQNFNVINKDNDDNDNEEMDEIDSQTNKS